MTYLYFQYLIALISFGTVLASGGYMFVFTLCEYPLASIAANEMLYSCLGQNVCTCNGTHNHRNVSCTHTIKAGSYFSIAL